MFGLPFMRRGDTPVLVADIEGGSVGLAVVCMGHSGSARVIAALRDSMPIGKQPAQEIAPEAIGTLIEQAGATVLESYMKSPLGAQHGPIRSVHVFLRAPLGRSRTVRAEMSFPEPRVITSQMIRDIAGRAITESGEFDRTNTYETTVIQVQLNGYPSGNPEGKRAASIAVVVLESACDKHVRRTIEDALGKLLPGRNITIRSGVRAFLSVIRERPTTGRNYLLIEVGSEATACITVRTDELAEQATVFEGPATIARRLAAIQGMPEHALSLLRLLAADRCSSPACEAVRAGLSSIEGDVAKSFGEAFAALIGVQRLPNTCLLIADPSMAEWLAGLLERIDFAQFTTIAQPFVVEILTPEHLSGRVSVPNDTLIDGALAIAADFVNTQEQSSR